MDFSKLEMNLTIILLFTLILFGIVAFAQLKSSERGKTNILNLSSVDPTKIIKLLSISKDLLLPIALYNKAPNILF